MGIPGIQLIYPIIPLSFQALLLHPIFDASPITTRFLRLLLAVPVVLYSLSATSDEAGWTPSAESAAFNFIFGVMLFYFSWKGIEFGLARNLVPYTWVGFDLDHHPKKRERKEGAGKAQTRYERALLLRKDVARDATPTRVILHTMHLLTSMRGIGYAFGSPPSPSSVVPSRPSQLSFLLSLLLQLTTAHVVLVLCALILSTPPYELHALLSDHAPFLPPSVVARLLVGIALGTSAYTGLTVFYFSSILPLYLLTNFIISLPFLHHSYKPLEFDGREYTSIIIQPWSAESVGEFWREKWHSFFTRSFKKLGYEPMQWFVKEKLGGGANWQRVAGTMGVFLMSAALHEFAIYFATASFPPQEMPFVTRWGASIYFLSQGVAIILEGAFKTITNRTVGGVWGRLWGLVVLGLMGAFVVDCWMTMGLMQGLPHFSRWSWARVFVPLACFSPASYFVV